MSNSRTGHKREGLYTRYGQLRKKDADKFEAWRKESNKRLEELRQERSKKCK